MHHFVTEMCTYVHISVAKWCIVRYAGDWCIVGFVQQIYCAPALSLLRSAATLLLLGIEVIYTTENSNGANFVVIGGTVGCHNDNFWCHQCDDTVGIMAGLSFE